MKKVKPEGQQLTTTERWDSRQASKTHPWPTPGLAEAIGRGLLGHCPACGKGPIFKGFLKVVGTCQACAAPLGLARADDAPPYLTILLVAHIIVPLLVLVDRFEQPSTLAMSAMFLPLTLALAVGLLRPIKGGTIGAMTSLDMLKPGDPTAL
jgi:uncharacterized protein (DUF983 family)